MPPRYPHPLPRIWLMTDERMGNGLIPAIAELPRGSGIVFRHYTLPKRERGALLKTVERAARRGRHWLVIGGKTHGRRHGAVTAPVHSMRERVEAERAGAKLLFVSPIYPTRSHPNVRPLGKVRFGFIVREAKRPVIALGGVTRTKARSLAPFKIYGWAAIDGFMR